MLYAGLDLSRKRLDFHLLDGEGATVEVGAAPPDADGLLGLTRRLDRHREPIRAAIESMNGARFVHGRLELQGWQVEIADAQKVKGLAPLACKTDRIDAWVLAELSRRDLVPAIWLPDPLVRAERERARWRFAPGAPPLELEAARARRLAHARQALSGLRSVRRTWPSAAHPARVAGAVAGQHRSKPPSDRRARPRDRRLRARAAPPRRRPSLRAALADGPGIGWVLPTQSPPRSATSAAFPSPRKLAGYTGLCPRVYQSGERDLRGPLAKQGPKYLRWALVEAATHACTATVYRDRYQQTKARIGKQRGAKVAQVDLARRLAEAIWHMLTREQPFAPKGATDPLAA